MSQLIIENEQLAYRLLRLAQEKGQSVELILDELLSQAEHETLDVEENAGMRLAKLAQEADIQLNVSANTDYDAILSDEMADDLWDRRP